MNSSASLGIDYANPVNRAHQLANGLAAWYLALPGFAGGAKWRDLMSPADLGVGNHGVLAVESHITWKPNYGRLGGFGSLNIASGTAISAPVDLGQSPYIRPTAAWTIAIWINPADASSIGDVLSTENTFSTHTGFDLFKYSDGNIYFDVGNFQRISMAYTANVWAHVVGSFDGVKVRLYQNGALIATSAGTPVMAYGATNTRIAGNYSGSNGYKGFLDDARIYNRALSSTDVAALYQNSLAGCPGLLRRIRPWWQSAAAVQSGSVTEVGSAADSVDATVVHAGAAQPPGGGGASRADGRILGAVPFEPEYDFDAEITRFRASAALLEEPAIAPIIMPAPRTISIHDVAAFQGIVRMAFAEANRRWLKENNRIAFRLLGIDEELAP